MISRVRRDGGAKDRSVSTTINLAEDFNVMKMLKAMDATISDETQPVDSDGLDHIYILDLHCPQVYNEDQQCRPERIDQVSFVRRIYKAICDVDGVRRSKLLYLGNMS